MSNPRFVLIQSFERSPLLWDGKSNVAKGVENAEGQRLGEAFYDVDLLTKNDVIAYIDQNVFLDENDNLKTFDFSFMDSLSESDSFLIDKLMCLFVYRVSSDDVEKLNQYKERAESVFRLADQIMQHIPPELVEEYQTTSADFVTKSKQLFNWDSVAFLPIKFREKV